MLLLLLISCITPYRCRSAEPRHDVNHMIHRNHRALGDPLFLDDISLKNDQVAIATQSVDNVPVSEYSSVSPVFGGVSIALLMVSGGILLCCACVFWRMRYFFAAYVCATTMQYVDRNRSGLDRPVTIEIGYRGDTSGFDTSVVTIESYATTTTIAGARSDVGGDARVSDISLIDLSGSLESMYSTVEE